MYQVVLVIHILSWTSWMAGLFYLPRIFVYHAERAMAGSEASEIFKIMEAKLLKYIMTPAMLATWATGLYLGIAGGWLGAISTWILLKIGFVAAMTGVHHALGAAARAFAEDRNVRTGRFFRIANEAPTVLFVFIVILAVFQPA